MNDFFGRLLDFENFRFSTIFQITWKISKNLEKSKMLKNGQKYPKKFLDTPKHVANMLGKSFCAIFRKSPPILIIF